jgi:hypothetical protein
MKRRGFSSAAWAVALVAAAGLGLAIGCLNPRPEELPSSVQVGDSDGAGNGGSGGSAGVRPPPGGVDGLTPSPDDPSSSGEDGGRELDGGRVDDASAVDAGAPTE